VILEQIKISPDQCLFILFRPIDEITWQFARARLDD
jgi:hypothetical protein